MERTDLSLHRTVLWGCLAEAFRPPEDAPFLLAAELPGAARALGIDADAVVSALDAGDDRTEAYGRLFGHIVRGPCPAHEGEYGEPRGFRFASEISDVQGFYRAFKLQPSRRLAERADHISVECEFMAFLALKEACARETHGKDKADLCRDASRKFLHDHLGRFGRAFAARVKTATSHPFYRAAAALLDEALVSDAERFDVPTGPADLPLREDAGTPEDACVACRAAVEAPR